MQQAIYEAFVSIGWWEILVTMCNTLITFAIIKKFLFKPVRKMLAQREEEVKTIYSAAEQAQTEAEQKRTEYTERLSKAKEEAAEIVGSATRRATVRSEEILKESSQQAAAMMKKAETTIEQERKKAMSEPVRHDRVQGRRARRQGGRPRAFHRRIHRQGRVIAHG